MTDEDSRLSKPLMWASGAAIVTLIALLAFAVIRTSRDATLPSDVAPASAPSVATSQIRTTSTTPTYTVPRVQTSEDTGPPASTGGSAAPPPVGDSSVPTSTTIFNPYVTTTPPAAGAI